MARYTVEMDAGGRLVEMLGIPRVVNPDGSFVLPSEYGAVGTVSGVGSRPGLVSGTESAAVFDTGAIRPGAVLRFGPFFRALDERFALEATAADLAKGVAVSLRGESFAVTMTPVGADLYEVAVVSNDRKSAVISHPLSKVDVYVDGTPAVEAKGYTKFAKTEEFDVTANSPGGLGQRLRGRVRSCGSWSIPRGKSSPAAGTSR